MKKLVTVLAIGLTLTMNAQEITQKQINKMTKKVSFVKFQKYTDINGNDYKIGDTLHIGRGSNAGDYLHLAGTVLLQPQPISPSHVGNKIIIKKMRVTGSKRRGFKLHVTTKIAGGFTYYFWLADCISSGEIIGNGYTSSQALKELKIAKDKLDLGLITKDQFNTLRNNLSKFIK